MTTENTTGTIGTKRSGRALNVVLWIVQGLLAAFFAAASALPKLIAHESAVEGFELIGAGEWFMYFIGAVELAGAIGLVIPRLFGLAAIGLSLLMIGAAYTNAVIVDGQIPVSTPLILLVCTAFVAWGRRDQTLRLFPRS